MLTFRDPCFAVKNCTHTTTLCDLRIYEIGSITVAVVTDLEDKNPGQSITNTIEEIALAIVQLRGEMFTHLVEHYIDRNPPDRSWKDPIFAEEFSVVTMERDAVGHFYNPDWKFITLHDLELLINERFE